MKQASLSLAASLHICHVLLLTLQMWPCGPPGIQLVYCRPPWEKGNEQNCPVRLVGHLPLLEETAGAEGIMPEVYGLIEASPFIFSTIQTPASEGFVSSANSWSGFTVNSANSRVGGVVTRNFSFPVPVFTLF